VRDNPELINVRPEETLNLTRLEPWLRTYLSSTDDALTVQQFPGGHANLTYLLKFGETEYVLKRPPLGPVAPTSHDMAREHRVLKRLGKTFPLAPTSFALCQDISIIGADFHVMERRRGFVIRPALPAHLHDDPSTVRRLSKMIVDTLADLHAIDPDPAGLANLGHPVGFVTRQLSGWSSRWHAAKDRERPSVDRLINWLHEQMPVSLATSLLHNDYKLDNILLDQSDPATATAVLDWDMCTRGDPLMDLGYLLNVWIEPDDPPTWREHAVMPSYESGFITRREVIERYAQRTGFDVGEALWYYAFGTFKLMVILQQISIRYLRGQTKDPRFANLGRRIDDLVDKGVALTNNDDRPKTASSPPC
jgi:aminoglycoside phosphotransferase (APT) family kinase protein